MDSLSVVGNVDKRIIVLPLARAFAIDGKTAIITDDTEYKRLLDNGAYTGSCHGIDIAVRPHIKNSDEIVKQLESMTKEVYKNIIYVSSNTIVTNAKAVVVVSGIDKSFLGDEVQKSISTEEIKDKLTEVLLSIDKQKVGKGVVSDGRVVIGSEEFAWLWHSDEVKELLPFTSKALNGLLSQIGGKVIGMQAEKFTELLNRDAYVKGKKK